MSEQPPARKLSRRTFDWLHAESRQWVEAGVLDEASRERILSQYDTESLPHRGTMALTLIAVLMCGIGVLLVIGYNWDRIPAAVKVALIMTSVAAAFTGAAAAYARKRHTLGEVLAFGGTLLFGNAIWLIAQVLHIQGHFPDAFLWFSIGALIAAFLVESVAIGIGAAVLAGVWILSEASFYPHIIYPFLVLWPCAVWVGYRLRSPMMVRLLGVTVAVWIAIAASDDPHANAWPGAVILTGCALYAIGRWHDRASDMAQAWRMSGLGTLLIMTTPLMASDFYATAEKGVLTSTVVITGIAALAAASSVARPVRVPADWAVPVTALVAVAWSVVVWSAILKGDWWLKTTSAITFSAVSLLLCVTLIRSAFRSNRTPDLVFGVLFGLAFLIVRWASVIENLLWSGLLLLVTGAGLLLVARQWLQRDRSLIAGRAS
jgi:uncharacterized membrane protein